MNDYCEKLIINACVGLNQQFGSAIAETSKMICICEMRNGCVFISFSGNARHTPTMKSIDSSRVHCFLVREPHKKKHHFNHAKWIWHHFFIIGINNGRIKAKYREVNKWIFSKWVKLYTTIHHSSFMLPSKRRADERQFPPNSWSYFHAGCFNEPSVETSNSTCTRTNPYTFEYKKSRCWVQYDRELAEEREKNETEALK